MSKFIKPLIIQIISLTGVGIILVNMTDNFWLFVAVLALIVINGAAHSNEGILLGEIRMLKALAEKIHQDYNIDIFKDYEDNNEESV